LTNYYMTKTGAKKYKRSLIITTPSKTKAEEYVRKAMKPPKRKR
jgi:hypothetical protein